MNNYIDLKVIDPDKQFMMNKLFSIVHAFIAECKKSDNTLAISFPYWEEIEEKIDTGDMIRLFGDVETLEKIKIFDGFKFLLKQKAIKIYDVKKTPETNSFIMFYRDRATEKTTFGFVNRQSERVKRYNSKENVNQYLPEKVSKKKTKIKSYFFKLKSESTHQVGFSLFVARKEANAQGESFNTYGLAKNDNKEIVYGVPHF